MKYRDLREVAASFCSIWSDFLLGDMDSRYKYITWCFTPVGNIRVEAMRSSECRTTKASVCRSKTAYHLRK